MNKDHENEFMKEGFEIITKDNKVFYDFKGEKEGYGVSCTIKNYYDSAEKHPSGIIGLVNLLFKKRPDLAIVKNGDKIMSIDSLKGTLIIDRINDNILYENI